MATEEQVNEINRLIELFKIAEETVEKWLVKASAESFNEMNRTDIQKCIEYLLLKTKGEK